MTTATGRRRTPLAGGGAAPAPRRILLLGSPGSGKTTLARTLGAATGLPVRHLDDEYWGAGWTRPSHEEWCARLDGLTGADRWIIDGNHLRTLGQRAPHADLVVLLDVPTRVCVRRVLLRAARIRGGAYEALPRRVREEAEAGHRVRATKDFLPLLRMVLRFRRRDWWRGIELVQKTSGARTVVVSAPGLLGTRTARIRRRLARRGVPADVVPLDIAPAELVRLTSPGPAGQAAGHLGTEGEGRT
ncbi:hypothetical protein CIB93_20580 [Streptomyces sp. WZ.A104]|uniref:hypothetical protein n=1 Tax=Streptomyces sp. WZ.A104 TaxID=2023771 RepID=UPI000BBCDFA9|nr:hypothetical protein [Streptomyces sp. WZ.A104]PCG84214.1 hypothetical protein CIB93_20580 [Streptomyces sp. WZ.A104]